MTTVADQPSSRPANGTATLTSAPAPQQANQQGAGKRQKKKKGKKVIVVNSAVNQPSGSAPSTSKVKRNRAQRTKKPPQGPISNYQPLIIHDPHVGRATMESMHALSRISLRNGTQAIDFLQGKSMDKLSLQPSTIEEPPASLKGESRERDRAPGLGNNASGVGSNVTRGVVDIRGGRGGRVGRGGRGRGHNGRGGQMGRGGGTGRGNGDTGRGGGRAGRGDDGNDEDGPEPTNPAPHRGGGRGDGCGQRNDNARLHPNNQRRIPIADVRRVYGHQVEIPLQAYRARSWNQKVTPEQVDYASEHFDGMGALHDIDTAFGLLPGGGAYKESNHYYGPGLLDFD